MKKVIALLALFCVAVFAQNTFTDPRDGKKYKSVKIGEQTWMAQNLDYHGEDGFLGLCYDDQPRNKIRKPENCQKYGRLYDWGEAVKACPSGWHLPNGNEWRTLEEFAGGLENAGKKLKAKSGWNDKCKAKNHCGTDEYGFSALPGGLGYSDGSFYKVGDYGYWWSANESGSNSAYYRNMYYDGDNARWIPDNKSSLFSVRCVKD